MERKDYMYIKTSITKSNMPAKYIVSQIVCIIYLRCLVSNNRETPKKIEDQISMVLCKMQRPQTLATHLCIIIGIQEENRICMN